MNLLCPSCQKMLQVPEQYAGQQMRCPLCSNTFTVPPLPDAPTLAPTPPPPPPQPKTPVYSLADESSPPPLPSAGAKDVPEFSKQSSAPAPAPAPPPVVGDY